MRRTALLALAALLSAQEPEKGPLVTALLELPPLRYPSTPGDAPKALALFLEAHEAHKRGELDKALDGYLAFRGNAGRHGLPARYLRTVEERLARLLATVRARYDAMLALYERDRKAGLAEARLLAGRHPALPEGIAALQLWHSDELQQAVKDARARKANGETAKAAAELATAVRQWVRALDAYEAKALLIELGGPDLFEEGEKIPGDEPGKKGEGGESTIEISDG